MSQYKYRISAKGFYFNKQNQVLLVKGKTLHNGEEFWSAPGGGVEEGESIYSACERELVEETGYFGNAQKIVYLQDFQFQDSGRNVEIFTVGEIDGSKPPLAEHDHEFSFFDQGNFNKITFLPEGINPFELREHNGANYGTYLN
ncbi:MAG: hypothetical protein BWY19_00830 [bacterium ADurb.Bin212]|nr:MAG: hypothetical protein BWY19_00830 [bacterium ADurb.Bin212]